MREMLEARRPLGRSALTVPRIALGCGNFGGIGSAPEFFGQGLSEDQAFALMDAAWEFGITPLRHRGRLRRRPQRAVDRPLDRLARGPPAADDQDVQPDGGRGRPRPAARADRPPAEHEPGTARGRPGRAVPGARFRPGSAAGGVVRRARPGAGRGQDRRLRRQQLRRRPSWPPRWRRARRRPIQNSYSLLDRRGRRGSARAVRRAGRRLPGLQPAGRRLAHRQVPARRAVPGRLADDPAPRALPGVRHRTGFRRPRPAAGRWPRPAAPRWPDSRWPGCSPTSG